MNIIYVATELKSGTHYANAKGTKHKEKAHKSMDNAPYFIANGSKISALSFSLYKVTTTFSSVQPYCCISQTADPFGFSDDNEQAGWKSEESIGT